MNIKAFGGLFKMNGGSFGVQTKTWVTSELAMHVHIGMCVTHVGQ